MPGGGPGVRGSALVSVAVSEEDRAGRAQEALSGDTLGGENGFRFSLDSTLSAVEVSSERHVDLEIMERESQTAHSKYKAQVTGKL